MFATFTSGKTPLICMAQTSLYESRQYSLFQGCPVARSCMKRILLSQSTHTNFNPFVPSTWQLYNPVMLLISAQ